MFTGTPYAPPPGDTALREALELGVQSIVLREDMDIEDRRRVAHLLNATHEYKWGVDLFGAVDIRPEVCYLEKFSNFEAMSKVADSEELTELVRMELGYGMEEDGGLKPTEKSKQLIKSKL